MERPQAVGSRRTTLIDTIAFAALTLLVWGLNALQRGLWQDDVVELGEAFQRSTHAHYLRAQFEPDASPLRRLAVLPSALANATAHPVWTLHILSGAMWLAQGLLAGWIVGLLLPGRRWTRFAVVCLTLTATSDYTTGSLVALAYTLASLFILAATGCALVWIGRGRSAALVASTVLLACSLLTMDVALPAVPFLLALFAVFGRVPPLRRFAVLVLAWTAVLIPVAIVEWSFLHDPASYAAMALVPLSWQAWVTRTLSLWIDNFAPWRWAFDRPEWYARSGVVISAAWMAAGSIVAAGIFLWRARTKEDDPAPEGGRGLSIGALFALMALAANAAYASVWFSEFHYRTHILSRVWASMAIGLFAGWMWSAIPRPRVRWAAYGMLTGFVFFGTWGGIERQDLFLGTWQRHQRELASILNAAPSIRPGTRMILRGTAPSHFYLATEAGYLATHWMRLLYAQPTLVVMRLDPQQGTGCAATADGMDCWLEGQAGCFVEKTCEPTRFRFDELVMMDYDARNGTYELVRSLRGDPLVRGHELDAERYRPERLIVQQPWTVRQRRLLLMPAQ